MYTLIILRCNLMKVTPSQPGLKKARKASQFSKR